MTFPNETLEFHPAAKPDAGNAQIASAATAADQ
jgi:hypothetical protein